MIPKIIHYVWIGEKPKPELVLRCIESWKKFLPDYAIVEWDNIAMAHLKNSYAISAYENKKWAFVSDYIRLYALYTQGGIYLDSDVEITNNLDNFLELDFFTGFENYQGKISPITAVMGATAKNETIHDMLKAYDSMSFDGQLVTNTVTITEYFKSKFNLHPNNSGANEIHLKNKEIIFPYFYFCTPEHGLTNYSIHHFNGSWLPEFTRKKVIFRFLGLNVILLKRNKKYSSKLLIFKNELLLIKVAISKKTSFAVIYERSPQHKS